MSARMAELIAERRVAPSILSADFSRLGGQLEEVMDAGARVIHFDVMDGRFVPPITIGPLVLSSIADPVKSAGGVVDAHLMISEPERHIEAFAEAGADSITFHEEATPHANRTLAAIRELGCLAGIAINPGTPVEALSELRGLADVVLCMTVNPGWGGQSFIEGSPDKVARLADLLGERLDGGPRVDRDARQAAELADRGEGPVGVRGRLLVEGDRVGAGLGEGLDVALGLGDHQVHVDDAAGIVDGVRDRREDQGADRYRGHEMAVHDVEVDDAGAGVHDLIELRAEPREVG